MSSTSIHAGKILHLGGNNVIDRIQRAGLGDARVPTETIREVGNRNIVDKIPGDPDFTFTMETLDVSTEPEAFLTGKVGAGTGSAQAPGAGDGDGTEYDLSVCGFLNIPSPWKSATTSSAGVIDGGHLVPGYYVSRVRYRFGVTENSGMTVELNGGSYYYGDGAPTEQQEAGDGGTTVFTTDTAANPHRIGGYLGTTFKSIFGVIVDGVLQTEGVDYTQSPSNTASTGVATLTFVVAPANGAVIKFAYFNAAGGVAFPDSVHASALTKPAAVRGRHICVYLGSGGSRAKVGAIQTAEVEFSFTNPQVVRELCNEEVVGVTFDGTDANGNLVVRAKSKASLFALFAKVTGVAATEVMGHLNSYQIPIEVVILNPRNPAQVLKTLYSPDAVFQLPGTNAQVNQPTDFTMNWESATGVLKVYKGAKA